MILCTSLNINMVCSGSKPILYQVEVTFISLNGFAERNIVREMRDGKVGEIRYYNMLSDREIRR